MTMIEAIRDAHDVMMGRDDNVVVFGEDAPSQCRAFTKVDSGIQC